MYALLFDRRSLVLTSAVLGGLGALLFATGFLVGALVAWERELVPPRWIAYGPLDPDALRVVERSPESGAAAGTVPGAAPDDPYSGAAPSVDPDGPGGGAGPEGADGEPGHEDDGWVPFARPGEVEALRSGWEGDPLDPELAVLAPGDPARLRPAPYRFPVDPPRYDRTLPPEPEAQPARSRAVEPALPATSRDAAEARAEQPEEPALPEGALGTAGDPADDAAAGLSPAAGSWYVQTGAFSVPANAHAEERALREMFAGEPWAPYLVETLTRRGTRFVAVRLGPFPTRGAALRVADRFDDVVVGRQLD